MKSVYILTDLEGVAGVVTFYEQTSKGEAYYDAACRLLTAEVNAATEGLLGEGVERVLVSDAHGPGGIAYEHLHEKAELIHGRPITLRQLLDPAGECDAVIFVGQHAMAGGATANLGHTLASKTTDCITINGRAVGEIALAALYVGQFGVPVVFLSGDEAACGEVQELIPGIVTASVKRGLGRNCAISVSIAESHRRIGEGVARAVRSHLRKPIAPVVWDGPFTLERRFFHTDVADQAAEKPGVERVDGQTVRICGDRIDDVLYRV